MIKGHQRLMFLLILAFSLFHLVRDILQTLHIENALTTILSTEKHWCAGYCNAISFPFEVFTFVGSLVVLKRKRVGLLGRCVLAVLLIWAGMFLYDYSMLR